MKKLIAIVLAMMLLLAILPTPVMADVNIQKTLSHDEACLGDHITVTIDVTGGIEGQTIVDTLPDELSYIMGTFAVDSSAATPIVNGQDVSYTLPADGEYTITFNAQVTSADYEDVDVLNVATVDSITASDNLIIHPYKGFNKGYYIGDHFLPPREDVHWMVVIWVDNIKGDAIDHMEEVEVKDRLGGDLELDYDWQSQGNLDIRETGKTRKQHLTWDLDGDLANGDSAWLVLDISTDINPGTGNGKKPGHQEYTEVGEHDLNSGAVLKFIDPETGFQLSAHTGPLTVNVEEGGSFKDVGYLKLVEKDPSNWSIVEDGAWGLLGYRFEGDEFEFSFAGTGLEQKTEYSLIYYADPWPGDGLSHSTGALIATMTTDASGNVYSSGSIDLNTDLPNTDDYNYNHYVDSQPHPGAKIWLVLSEDYDESNTKMTGWDPYEYLFESNTIVYDDTDA